MSDPNPNSIAVIIPTFNSMRFLRETLDSVLAQTLPPTEILVNDDGSTDGTPDFAESYSPLIRVFRRAGQRQAASRNFAATQTQCEWLAFNDHDDLWEPDKLRLQLAELTRHLAAGLCYSARILYQQQPDGTYRRGKLIPVPPPSGLRDALYRNTTFMPGSVLVRRETFLAAGGFDTSFRYVEDWDLWLRLFHAGVPFVGVEQPLLLYRLHGQNLSTAALPALAEAKRIYRTHVLPRLPFATRWFAHQISQSGQESAAAYMLRQTADPRHLSLMATSILRNPFADPHRYKVFAHMLYTRLRPKK